MATEELATQRLRERLQSSRWWWCKGESYRGSSKFFWRDHVVGEGRQIVLDAHREV
jgi:hypothetical protein